MNEAKKDKLTNNLRSAKNNWDFWTGLPEAINRITITMGDAPEFIKRRHIENCAKADPAYGRGVAKAMGLE